MCDYKRPCRLINYLISCRAANFAGLWNSCSRLLKAMNGAGGETFTGFGASLYRVFFATKKTRGVEDDWRHDERRRRCMVAFWSPLCPKTLSLSLVAFPFPYREASRRSLPRVGSPHHFLRGKKAPSLRSAAIDSDGTRVDSDLHRRTSRVFSISQAIIVYSG